MAEPDVSALTVGPRDLIVLHISLEDDQIDDMVKALHSHFPENMVLFLNPGEAIEARDEEEAKYLLKAIADHQEYREHKALTEVPEE